MQDLVHSRFLRNTAKNLNLSYHKNEFLKEVNIKFRRETPYNKSRLHQYLLKTVESVLHFLVNRPANLSDTSMQQDAEI
jgi:hypothetical protein